MRLVMMGTGPFAVPTFVSLLKSPYDVVALLTRPPKAVRGKRHAPTNPMMEKAVEHDVKILMPENVNSQEARDELSAREVDLLVVCDYGQILSQDVLSLPRLGGVNLHGSLLPHYRGAAPVNWALFDGRTETGVTVIHLTSRLDAGPSLCSRRVTIGPRETAAELEMRLAELGVEAVHQAIGMLEAWDGRSALGTVQDPANVTRAPRLKKTDGQVDWNRTAIQISNQVRAMTPWPGSYTYWLRDGATPLRLILEQVTPLATVPSSTTPGSVEVSPEEVLTVTTGAGTLRLDIVQPSGKRLMSAAEFLRGYRLKTGDALGG